MTAGKNQPLNRRQWVLAALADYEGRLTRYARRMLRDDEAARDAVQHTFLQLCDQRPETLARPLAAWLFTVCRNKALDLAKNAGRVESLDAVRPLNGHATESECGYSAGLVGREPDPADVAETGELCKLLKSLVEGLPDNQREAVDLWCEGFSHRQIGEITSRSEGNVRLLVHRALTRLRSHASVRRWLEVTPEKAFDVVRVP